MLFRLILLAVSALALSLAFAPFPLRFLSPIALVPLFWVIDTSTPGEAFRYGLFFGSVFYLFHLWWLYALVVPVEPATRILLDLGVTLLFVYLGLYVALFALATKHLGLLWSPFIWAALEWIRSQSEAGFPWGLLGTSLTPYPPAIQGAALIGVYGMSALVVWIALLVYKSIKRRGRAVFVPLLAVSLAVPVVYGLVRIRPSQPWFRVGLIQPNVSPLEKGRVSEREETWRAMLRLSRAAISRKARVLVFPETATLVDISREVGFRDSLQLLANSGEVLIITGTPRYFPTGTMNATALIEPHEPAITQYYMKTHPAPFSERFPFVDKVPLLRRIMTRDMGDMIPGREYKVFDVGGHRFSTAICFEGIFPDLIREFTRRGAEMIVVVTNDGWFGRTPGPYQHNELMIMRAVENGVPLVRSANNGISLVADPYGKVLAQTGLYVMTDLVQDVPRPLPGTFYRRYGDRFSPLCLIAVGILILLRIIPAIVGPKRQAA